MIWALRYFVLISIFGFATLIFWWFISLHVYAQMFTCYICKEYDSPQNEYDFIVVGSGTAGSIVAHRLSQDKKSTVLLLEAGPYSNFLFDIPVLGPFLQLSSVDWKYETVPQKEACLGLTNNVSRWPMGKIFGGTGRLNNMVYVRGHKDDFADWYKNKSDYNYETDILSYFKKLENRRISNNNSKYYSNGPIEINSLPYVSPLANAVLKAAKILGYSTANTNAESISGFMEPKVNLKNGKRWTTSDNLLLKKSRNLHILTNAVVTKVLLKDNFEAYGIRYNQLKTKRTIMARKGIILSAGVIGTPKLLMLSGIGPKLHLQKLKIPVHKNLPVGRNLQDHVTTGLDLITLNKSLLVNVEMMMNPVAAIAYFVMGTGPWTAVGCEVVGFCHSKGTSRNSKPNLGFMVLPVGITQDGGKHLKNAVSVSQHVWDSYFINMINQQTVSILPIVLHPKSVGTVKLRSSDPNAAPIINPRYLSKPEDVKVLLAGINIIKKLIKTAPMQELGAKLNKQKFPGCTHFKYYTNAYWECYVRRLTLTTFHPVGTCKLGHSKDIKAVVDYDFKVRGTNKLFVADASVMPSLTSANINAAVAVIAEKAADSIKLYAYLTAGACHILEIFVPKPICLKLN